MKFKKFGSYSIHGLIMVPFTSGEFPCFVMTKKDMKTMMRDHSSILLSCISQCGEFGDCSCNTLRRGCHVDSLEIKKKSKRNSTYKLILENLYKSTLERRCGHCFPSEVKYAINAGIINARSIESRYPHVFRTSPNLNSDTWPQPANYVNVTYAIPSNLPENTIFITPIRNEVTITIQPGTYPPNNI